MHLYVGHFNSVVGIRDVSKLQRADNLSTVNKMAHAPCAFYEVSFYISYDIYLGLHIEKQLYV